MEHKVMILCDLEEEYALHMSTFLKKEWDLPWEILVYTNVDKLLKTANDKSVHVLLISETAYEAVIGKVEADIVVVLNESGAIRWKDVKNIDKYQQAGNVLKELLNLYIDEEEEYFPPMSTFRRTKIIGMYSPVRRCLQTSFALTFGQILAREHRTLYLNFEHYAGLDELLPGKQEKDLATLLYFLETDKNRFVIRMKTLIQQKGGMDYIPPMMSGQNMVYITAKEWIKLIGRIVDGGEYDYILLDLSESMQGLLAILKMCQQVFTIVRDDRIAKCKMDQYEQMLALYEMEDVLSKTKKCTLPRFQEIPENIEQYTRGELAEYVNKLVREELA